MELHPRVLILAIVARTGNETGEHMQLPQASLHEEKPGTIFNIQYFSIHDGPGIRTTLFLKGCPLHCPWCSNPESQCASVQVRIVPEKCRACSRCLEVCETGALNLVDGRITLDYSKCSRCMACAAVCANGGITSIGTILSPDETKALLLKDRAFYDHTGGGVTISGGEPLLQHEFLTPLIRGLHREGIHIALDTTGYAPWQIFEGVLSWVDLLLFDVKHLDAEKHRKIIGVDNTLILDNLKRCSGLCEIWLRIPLIPGFNDDVGFADAAVELAHSIGARRCCFLPFHRWGEHKYERLGLANPYTKYSEFSSRELDLFKTRYHTEEDLVFFETF
jgi:pyruvate formate lyase activating enzyme